MSQSDDNQSDDYCEDEEEAEDDEATLDEEDLNETEDYDNELKELQQDGELSLEELRRKYCGGSGTEENEEANKEAEKQQNKVKEPEVKEEKNSSNDANKASEPQDYGDDDAQQPSSSTGNGTGNTSSISTATSTTSARRIGSLRGNSNKLFTALATSCETIAQYFKAEDLLNEDDDSDDYLPPELWKKEIRVGPEFQVVNIPEVIPMAKRRKLADNEPLPSEEVLWKPSPTDRCTDQRVAEYLVECEQIRAGEKPTPPTTAKNNNNNGPVAVGQQQHKCRGNSNKVASNNATVSAVAALSPDEIVPDDENALLALYQADYDARKAKSKAPFEWPALCSANGPRLTQPPGPWRTWTEQDCDQFERGLLEHGKHFWKIRRDYLPNRMLGEIVCFYYSWKKSERHDAWQVEKSAREQQQLDVKTTDLMGQIADTLMQGHGGAGEGNAAATAAAMTAAASKKSAMTMASAAAVSSTSGEMVNNGIGTTDNNAKETSSSSTTTSR